MELHRWSLATPQDRVSVEDNEGNGIVFCSSIFLTLEAVWRSGGGRSSCKTQLVEFSHVGSNQPISEYCRRQSDDTQTTSHTI